MFAKTLEQLQLTVRLIVENANTAVFHCHAHNGHSFSEQVLLTHEDFLMINQYLDIHCHNMVSIK
jgi:hypothetical protein